MEIQTNNRSTQTLEHADQPQGESIFHDRHDGPFVRWMEEQGLNPDASDALIMSAMQQYFEAHNTASIVQAGHK